MRQQHEWFGPDDLVRPYLTYAGIAAVCWFAIVGFVLVVSGELLPAAAMGGVGVVVFAFVVWWVFAFARSVGYRLNDDGIEYRRGVWWRKHSTVPYDRITNVDVSQGPIVRWFGVGGVAVQTAGYNAQTGAELTLNGLRDYEAVRDQVLDAVRGRPAVAVEAGFGRADRDPTDAASAADDAVLAEVRRIRELIESGGIGR